MHLLAAPALAGVWGLSSWVIESLVMGGAIAVPDERRREEILLIGTNFCAIVAGVSYAVESSARAARAEAIAAGTQLAALRAQLHPHFLFNALHTAMQLVPADPMRAARALELVAELLRAPLGDQRDEVSRTCSTRAFLLSRLSADAARLECGPGLVRARACTGVHR